MIKEDQRKTGFTLIELLVAISIIAVLMGILLPVLGAVKRQAQSGVCLSNIRQISLAAHTYAADNGGLWINYRWPNTISAHKVWNADIAKGDWWSSRLAKQGYLPEVEVFQCPSFKTTNVDMERASVNQTVDNPAGVGGAVWNKVHYGFNVRFLGSKQGWAFPEQTMPDGTVLPSIQEGPYDQTPTQADITDPSHTIAFTDSKNRAWEMISSDLSQSDSDVAPTVEGIGYLYPAYDPPEIQYGYSHARHSKSINVAWADGHGDKVSVNDLDNPYHADELTSVPDHPLNNLWDLK